MGFSVVSVAFVVMDQNMQSLIDKQMCKPGYTWNHTLKRCLGYGGGQIDADPGLDPVPELENPELPPALRQCLLLRVKTLEM